MFRYEEVGDIGGRTFCTIKIPNSLAYSSALVTHKTIPFAFAGGPD